MRGRKRGAVVVVASLAVLGASLAGAVGPAAGPAAATSHCAPSTPPMPDGPRAAIDLAGATAAAWTVTPGVEQVTVTGAPTCTPLTLVDAADVPVVTLTSDHLGQLVIAYVPDQYLAHDPNNDGVLPTVDGSTLSPGDYRLVDEATDPDTATATFTVLDVDDVPDPALYDGQTLVGSDSTVVPDGQFQYIEVRDGVTLSAVIHFPPAALYGPGPYPTVVEYNGYSPSAPGPPSQGRQLANLMGYATVGVNLRGTGCSGGTFDGFNAAQMADGYDVVETVARQGWVKGNKVGMIGLSYGGITQLYVAPTNPPSLAAIAPQSVIEDPWYQQWPGGIYNSGFTQEWLANRDASSDPGASGWVADRIAGGDAECEANAGLESLRWQNIDFEEFGASLQTRPADAEARRLSNLVPEIDVPVFLTGAWQDEQTGQRFATLLDDFTAAPVTRFTMFNGRHADGFTPLVLDRWFEFLELYVNGVVPDYHPSLQTPEGQALVDGQLTAVFGVPGLPLGEERFAGMSHGDALAAYEAEPDVRVLFEVGAAPEFVDNPPETGTCSDAGAGGLPPCNHPGAPVERWERTFEAWPPSAAEAATLYLGPDGTLRDEAPGLRSIDRFAFDPDAGQTSYYLGGDWLKPQIEADWKATDAGEGLAYQSEPLADDVVIGGDGYVDLWFRSTGTDAPIEVVLSEVYQDPDPGDAVPAEELIVQHGLLRAGWSQLDPARTTPLLKEHLFSAQDYVPLEQGEFVHLQVPVFSIAHAFRAGSRIRLEVNTPGGDTPRWEFINQSYGATTHDVAMGGDMTSALVLPVLPPTEAAGQVPTEFAGQANHPPCNSVRGQVCRDAAELTNETVYLEPACDETRFPDVGPSGFCGDITWLSDEGVTDGYGDGTFRPTEPISRQAMAAFLYRTEGEPNGPDPGCTTAPFPDVPVSSPFCGAIQWLVEAGVASGYDDGHFRPTAPVTRQATAAFLYRVAGLPAGDPPTCADAPFPDVGADAELCGEVAWLAGTGITDGFEDGSFRPGAPLSRQAMAAFLHRFHVWRV